MIRNIVVVSGRNDNPAKLQTQIDPVRLPHGMTVALTSIVYGEILNKSGKKVDFLIATPPCQGMSVAGKNRDLSKMVDDKRNYLIFRVVDFIKEKNPDFVLIENVF